MQEESSSVKMITEKETSQYKFVINDKETIHAYKHILRLFTHETLIKLQHDNQVFKTSF